MRRNSCQPRVRGQVLVQSNACREASVLIGIATAGAGSASITSAASPTNASKRGVGDRLRQCGAAPIEDEAVAVA